MARPLLVQNQRPTQQAVVGAEVKFTAEPQRSEVLQPLAVVGPFLVQALGRESLGHMVPDRYTNLPA